MKSELFIGMIFKNILKFMILIVVNINQKHICIILIYASLTSVLLTISFNELVESSTLLILIWVLKVTIIRIVRILTFRHFLFFFLTAKNTVNNVWHNKLKCTDKAKYEAYELDQ